MALSCLLGRCSSSFKAQTFKSLQVHLLKPNSAVKISKPLIARELCCINKNLKPDSLSKAVSRFSTSPSRLADHKAHDHSKLWTFERVLSVALLPLVPAALIHPCTQLDTAVALLIVMHTHFGLEAVVVDYVRPILFGPLAPKIGLGLLYVFSIVTFAGLLNLIYNDIGLANTVISVWRK